LEIFKSGQIAVQIRLFGNVAKTLFEAGSVVADVAAVEENLTLGGVQESCHHFDSGGFAGTIRAEIPGDLAGVHGEVDMIHHGLATESLDQIAYLEHG
jgi:hypothetical protein